MPGFVPLSFQKLPESEMQRRADAWCEQLSQRRSVREFSPDPVPLAVVRRCIETAARAPSGANKQPWSFALITTPELKRQIRQAAEREEYAFYHGRASPRWLEDLRALGTDEQKPFLEEAPVLIAVFAERFGPKQEDTHYYVSESVGIAVGFLIAALHHAGLATLTHTPSPMKFLSKILQRPDNERAFLLLPVGYPAENCQVPLLERKSLARVLVEY